MNHTTDKEVLLSIIPKYLYKESDGIKVRWKEVVKVYEQKTGHKRAIRTLQKYITDEDKEKLYNPKYDNEVQEEIIYKEIPPNELEILKDGTQKLLAYKQMSETQSKNPDYVMRVNGYDPNEWELIRLRVNEWTARNKDNEELYHYQIRLDVKPIDDSVLTKKDVMEVNRTYSYNHQRIPYEVKFTKKAMEVGFTDLHIGSQQFSFSLLKEKTAKIKSRAEFEEVERMILVFNGDILHVDNTNKTTVQGTQLEMNMSAFEMYRLAKDVTNYIVMELATIETHVYWVQGNHSRLPEFALFDGLADSWKENEHIRFDVDELRRKAYLYGKQLVGLYHGDMPKKNRFDWLQRDYRELWGQAKYVEQHSGHFHNEEVTSKGAIINRVMPTIKETDDYEYSMGYDNISMAIQSFIYDKEDGLQQINYY